MTRLSIPSNIWNELRPFSVGFDDLFNRFDNTLEYTVKQPTSYPPYNINKIDDLNYQIEMQFYLTLLIPQLIMQHPHQRLNE